MHLITAYPLGADIASSLLILAALSVIALVAGVVIGRRADRDEDTEALDDGLGTRLGSLLSGATATALIVGVPALGLLLLATGGGLDDRLLRSGMLLAGLAVGPITAWRATGLLVPVLGLAPENRQAAVQRVGALFVSGTLAIVALPIAALLWFLRQDAGIPLLAFAAGLAIFALSARATSAFTDVAAGSSAVLAGADENDLDREADENPGAVHQRLSDLFGRGPGRAAEIAALAAAAVAVTVAAGIEVLAAEAVLVAVVGLGVALLAALAVSVIPHVGRDGREADGLRVGGLVPTLLGGGGLIAAMTLWLPSAYKDLRFDQVGLGKFTDKAIVGDSPIARSDMEPQILEASKTMDKFLSQTDDSSYAATFLDTLVQYMTHPNVLVAFAIGIGALTALLGLLLLAHATGPTGPRSLAIARTSRTGGALAGLGGFGGAAATTGFVLALLAIALVGLTVISAGMHGMLATLLGIAALGGLVVLAAHSAAGTAAVVADRAGSEEPLRTATRQGETETSGALAIAGTFAALGLVSVMTSLVEDAPRAGSVWEDRYLHALGASSGFVIAGMVLALITVLLTGASLLESARRIGTASVVDTRASLLDGGSALPLTDLIPGARRAALLPVVIAVLMPVVAAGMVGPAALPSYVATVVVVAGGLALWANTASASFGRALDLIEQGRYGGKASWGHSAALGNAMLGTGLRGAVGQLALPAALTSSLGAALITAQAIGWVTGDTNAFLRWGISLVAVLLIVAAWVYTASVPEPDLEDRDAVGHKPLFARNVQEEDSLPLELDWEAGSDPASEEVLDEDEVRTSSKRARARRRRDR